VNLPNLKVAFNGITGAGLPVATGATYKMAVTDTPHSRPTSVPYAYRKCGDSDSDDFVPSNVQAEQSTGDTEKSLRAHGDDQDGSQLATEMSVDSDDDTMTLASLGHIKPAAKPSYKYKYNSFMQDCTKLATAVQNRPQVAEAVHGTIVMLTRIAQGQEGETDNKSFEDIIDGARASFGAKRRIHSGLSVTQAGKQHVPVSANPGALGRPMMTRKRSYTEGKAPVKGSNEKPECGFCDQKGHNIVSCTVLKRYGERVRGEQDLQQLADDLLIADGQFPATRITDELMTKARQILLSLPTETKFLAVHRKYIINNDIVGPVRSQNLCILVTCIGVGGHPIPECNQVLAQASIVNGWMNKSRKKYKHVISSLTRDTFLQTQEPDAIGEPYITQNVEV
jgi:hypothetical protein